MPSRAPNGPLPRPEFDSFVRRHEADAFAHTALMNRVVQEGLPVREDFSDRLSALERWQQRIIGGLLFAALLLGGGGITAVIELTRK